MSRRIGSGLPAPRGVAPGACGGGAPPRGRGQRGAALVEFALILPLIMSLILGLITGGAAYNQKLSMTNAVREGSRFGSTLDGTGTWATSVRDLTVQMAAGDLTASQVCVKLVKVGTGDVAGHSLLGSECSSITPFSTPPGPTGQCVVEVWAARPAELEALFYSWDMTLTAKAASLYQGTVAACS